MAVQEKNIAYIEKEGTKVTNPKEIINIFTSHLGERYSRTIYGETSLLENIYLAELSPDEMAIMENPITSEELSVALQGMKDGKSPGSNGYTVEFF